MPDPFTLDPVRPDRLSMSFLRSAGACLRRAHLEREADVTGPDALVGRFTHEALAAGGLKAVTAQAARISPDEAERIARAIMAGYGEADPLAEAVFTDVLDLTRRWAGRASFRPGERFEVDSRLNLGGRTLSARIDRFAVDGPEIFARDYKTGWADPAEGLTFQGRNYGWHLLVLHPEIRRVNYVEEHVRFGTESAPAWIEREDLPGIEDYLLTAIARIDGAYAAGDLPATPGSACSRPTSCPVAHSCPVPAWARPATWLETEEQAAEELERLLAEEAVIEGRKAALRGYLAREDRRSISAAGEEIGWSAKPGSSLDTKALLADHPEIDLDDYRKTTNPTFGRRRA